MRTRSVAVIAAAAAVALAAPAAAFPPTSLPDEYTLREPITVESVNPCTGETFTADGTMHVLFAENVAASGNFQDKMQTSFQARGTGSFGNEYVLTYAGPASETYTFAAPGGAYGSRQTYVQHANVIALGPAPDYHAVYLIHMTHTPDGEPTATVEHIESRCTR